MAGKGKEKDRCGSPDTAKGQACRAMRLPGFSSCMYHLKGDELEAAEQAGWHRCKHQVTNKMSPRYGDRCAQPAVEDSEFCVYHQPPGNWIVPMRWKDRRMVYGVSKMAQQEGIDTSSVENPLQALLEISAEAMALKDELKRRVITLQDEEWRYDGMAGEQIRGEIVLYERALDRVARLMVQLTRLNIEERLARVTERQAYIIDRAIAHALEESGIPIEVQDKARKALASQLRAVS